MARSGFIVDTPVSPMPFGRVGLQSPIPGVDALVMEYLETHILKNDPMFLHLRSVGKQSDWTL